MLYKLIIILEIFINKLYNMKSMWYILNLLIMFIYLFMYIKYSVNIASLISLFFMTLTTESLMCTLMYIFDNKLIIKR